MGPEAFDPEQDVPRGPLILLVDDDARLCALMAEYFAANGYRLEIAHDGRQGLAQAAFGVYDLIILDVMLPLLDGFEVLRQLRRESAVPVIMLTARVTEVDRIAGLDAGADDYLPKPFGPAELLARIRAVLRRSGHRVALAAATLTVNDLRMDVRLREVWRADNRIDLTAIEFDILEMLVRSSGRVVSRDAIATVLYKRETTPYERTLDVHMSHLRKKLGYRDRTAIRTVRGVGYLLTASE
jgi:DNA-binding response OmpR family regulator